MNVTLTPELEVHVRALIQKGLYADQSEVVQAALRLLIAREHEREARLGALGKGVGEGLRQVLDGSGSSMSAEEFKARGRRVLSS